MCLPVSTELAFWKRQTWNTWIASLLGSFAVSAVAREGISEDEQKQQANLLRLSRIARQTIALHSGHFIQLDRPDLVIDRIKGVLTSQGSELHLQ
jgi:hypothetical protein